MSNFTLIVGTASTYDDDETGDHRIDFQWIDYIKTYPTFHEAESAGEGALMRGHDTYVVTKTGPANVNFNAR